MSPVELTGPSAAQATSHEELREQYRAYRVRHARRLVRLLPREAIRPLYRRALEARGEPQEQGDTDSMALLVEFCEGLLPLPPFEVWMEDVTLHPVPHLRDLDDSADVPTARTPATIESRLFEYGADPWIARLRSFRDEEAWRGYIAFEERRTGRLHHTSVIFREADPSELRERFLSFEDEALEAFLRSALP